MKFFSLVVFALILVCLVESKRRRKPPTCNGVRYNANTHGCCGRSLFAKSTQKCCYGRVIPRAQHCPHQFTCGGRPYNPGLYGCCGGRWTYHKLVYKCCFPGRIVPRFQSCIPKLRCGWILYNPVTHKCCPGNRVVSRFRRC